MTRKPVVYHIIHEGRRQVSAASTLVLREGRVAVELDPRMVQATGVFVEIDPRKLRTLDDDGYIFGYPELVDRRQTPPRRRNYSSKPPRSRGRRSSDTGRGR
ncbi:MAG: hypothetical protein ABR570_17870 [Burkholderiales bacterium]